MTMLAACDDLSSRLKSAAGISSCLVLPFVILEARTRADFFAHFPGALFVVMWLLPFAFVLVWPRVFTRSTPLILRGVALLVLAALWLSLVIDQMPCFLGIPNCD